jgi:tetratricopeptide (TPR) repeat protein
MKRADSLQFVYAQTFLDGDFQPDYDDGKMPYFLAFMANRYVDKDKERQAAALRWVRKSIDLDGDDYKNKFVLARLLYNAGELYEALEWAEQALAAEQTTSEAGVIKTLFKADTISAFIDAIKSEIYNQSD